MMKKYTSIIVCSIIITLCCVIGVLSYHLWVHRDWNSTYESSTEILKSTEQISIKDSEILSANEIVLLDNEYEKEITAAYSNFEKGEVNYEFAEKWDKFADKYYNEIMKIASDDFKKALTISQDEWKKYAEVSEETQLRYLQDLYEYGTIVPVLHSYYTYDLHRERAIEIYEMYFKLKPLVDGSLIDN